MGRPVRSVGSRRRGSALVVAQRAGCGYVGGGKVEHGGRTASIINYLFNRKESVTAGQSFGSERSLTEAQMTLVLTQIRLTGCTVIGSMSPLQRVYRKGEALKVLVPMPRKGGQKLSKNSTVPLV